jgi:hypothetical protein
MPGASATRAPSAGTRAFADLRDARGVRAKTRVSRASAGCRGAARACYEEFAYGRRSERFAHRAFSAECQRPAEAVRGAVPRTPPDRPRGFTEPEAFASSKGPRPAAPHGARRTALPSHTRAAPKRTTWSLSLPDLASLRDSQRARAAMSKTLIRRRRVLRHGRDTSERRDSLK